MRDIGAPAQRLSVGGNLKFDVTAPAKVAFVAQLRGMLRHSRTGGVLVAGSTVEGEEPLLYGLFQAVLEQHPRALLVVAPRHPERFDGVASLLSQSQLPVFRRSRLQGDEELAGCVLVLDSIGELAATYELADVAFVGGSLAPRGGHNILEPAQFGKPILVGPHTENFRDIVSIFRRHDAVRVGGVLELAEVALQLFDDPGEREALGGRARQVFDSQAGATLRTLQGLEALLPAEVRP